MNFNSGPTPQNELVDLIVLVVDPSLTQRVDKVLGVESVESTGDERDPFFIAGHTHPYI